MHDFQRKIANAISTVLKGILIIDANTNSSTMIYQPKTPSDIKKYKRKK